MRGIAEMSAATGAGRTRGGCVRAVKMCGGASAPPASARLPPLPFGPIALAEPQPIDNARHAQTHGRSEFVMWPPNDAAPRGAFTKDRQIGPVGVRRRDSRAFPR